MALLKHAKEGWLIITSKVYIPISIGFSGVYVRYDFF